MKGNVYWAGMGGGNIVKGNILKGVFDNIGSGWYENLSAILKIICM